MNVAQLVLGRSKAIVFVTLVLAALGVRSYLNAPQSIFPAMSFARIDVVADAGDLTPEQVRLAVTRPLETAFGTLPAVTRVRANSSQGSAEIVVEFATQTDARVDLQYVRAAIASLAPTLPAARKIDAVTVNPNAEPIVSFGLTSRVLSQAALNAFITTRIVPTFAGTPGLGRVSVVGGPPIEYRVELDPGSLAAVGLSAADVATAIADATDVVSVGSAERYHQRYVLLIDAGIHDARSLGRIGVPLKTGGSVALRLLGRIALGVGPASNAAAVNGVPAVMINAFALAGADAVSVAETFKARLDGIRDKLPADVQIVQYWDQTRLIVDSQRSLRDAILIGALLACVVIYAFLRSVRMTLVAAAIIPLALAISVFALERSGLSLNLMSVGGLAVAVGLIIDDTIVVIEAIARDIAAAPDAPRRDTIAGAVGKIAGAMTASTLTTVVVFVPLGLLSGVTGFFFRALAFTLSASLIISLLLAIGVAPALAGALLRTTRPHAEQRDRLHECYAPIFAWALDHRAAVFAGATVILVTTVVLLAQLPTDFLPRLDEGQFEVKYTLPAGATLSGSDEAAGKMERVVLADADVLDVGRLTGIDTNGFSPTQANTGTLRIALRSGGRASYDTIATRLRDALAEAVPAANVDFHQLLEDQINDLSGAPQPVEIAIAGPDQNQLLAAADRTTAAISHVHGVVDAFDGIVFDDPALRLTPQPRLAELGLSGADVGSAIAARTQGLIAAHIPGENAALPVDVRIAGGTPDLNRVASTPLFVRGTPTTLGALADTGAAARTSDVNEENGRRIDRVTANIAGASLSTVVAGLHDALGRGRLPPGYSATIGGAYATQQASFREFLSVIAIAIVLVFGVMLGTFGSFRLPLVILCAIPLALIGVALALVITRTPINVSSFMGLLLLVGIVVKNGILLIDVANRRRAAGDDVMSALTIAGATRLRPIVMTTLAAIGGLFPLAVGLGSGAEMERPLAIAVIGGLSTATAFTLIVIPVLYATFLGGSRRSFRARAAIASIVVVCVALPHAAGAQALPSPFRFASIDVDAAQQLAVVASPDVATARATLDAARAGLGTARSATGLQLVGGYAEVPQGSPAGTIAQRTTSYGAQITLGDVTAYAPFVRQAAAGVQAAQIDEAAAERSERIKAIGRYFGALKARAIAGARADAVVSAGRQLAAAQLRFRAGDAPRLDVVRAQVALARAQADFAGARAADGSATDELAREVCRPSAALDATLPLPPAVQMTVPTPEAAVARALAVRADVRSADLNLESSAAGVAAAQRGFIPPITLGAGYNRGEDSGYPIAGPTLTAQVVLPIGGAIAARVHLQRALLAAAQAKRDAVRRAVALEVGAATRTASATIEAERASDAAALAAGAELDAATLGYGSGASTSLDLSTSRATYVAAVVDALDARYDRLQAQAILVLEVGA